MLPVVRRNCAVVANCGARSGLVRFCVSVCVCLYEVLVMVSRQTNLVTGDLFRWSLQVNEYSTMIVSSFVIFKRFFSVGLQMALCADRSVFYY